MARRKVERTRNGKQWTEARFWQFIRSGLRKTSRRWPPIVSEALKQVRREYKGENKRRKWEYQCQECGNWYKSTEVQVDHIVSAGSLKSFEDLPGFCERLFCEVDGLQVLCGTCHQKKTNKEKK